MGGRSKKSKPRVAESVEAERVGPGRPPHAPTDQTRLMAEQLAGLGLPHHMICRLVGVSEDTLRKHYSDELKLGEAKATAKVAKTLFEKATVDRDTASLIFWMKARAGWSERFQIEATGEQQGRDAYTVVIETVPAPAIGGPS